MNQRSDSNTEGFSKIRAFLWPIHRHELKKVVPMLAVFFLISFAYNILRNMKDALIVTAEGSGAEAIPFIKFWVLLPTAIILTTIFTRLASRMRPEYVFYSMVSLFLSFFAVFVLLLYPNRDVIHLHGLGVKLAASLPEGFSGGIAMVRYWSFTLFYVMSELWGTILLSMLFWGFANDITKTDEAKRFYALFSIGANFSGIFSGEASMYLSQNVYNPNLPFGDDAWHQSLVLLLGMVLACGMGVLMIFRWIHTTVLTDPRFIDVDRKPRKEPVVKKMSLRENFGFILNNRYLLYVAIIVFTYNMVINLTEVVWKDQVRLLHSNPSDYNAYMNHVTMWMGIVATFIGLFITGNAMRRIGWTFTALVTPTILLVTAICFYCVFFPREQLQSFTMAVFGYPPVYLVALIGSIQNVLSRGSKYTLFDATKEYAYIPLSPECRIKGKSAIDGVGSRMGKSGGAVVQQCLILSCGSLVAAAPYIAVILFACIFCWIVAVKRLGIMVNEREAGLVDPASTSLSI